MEFTPMRIQSVAKEVIKLIHASLPSTITIVQDIDNDCPTVMADPTRIHQIFMNLITNAFHSMEVSGGVLHVSLKTQSVDEEFKRFKDVKATEYVCIKISDTGSGMDREVMDRIFNPYFTTKPEGKGTGLGLSVIHGIVESHNGHITVESQPGIGTTFEIYLPCLAEETVPEAPLEYDPVMGGSEKILLVDDEASIVSMVTDMLQRLGYRVTCHTSSLEALELFRAQPDNFDLVITDLTMPNMTGDRLAKEIKQIRPDIPIIICTGFSSRIDTNSPEAQYVDAYIHKPVIRRDLDADIRTVLKNARNNS
jgi:CheY-like chemotaxis protein